MSIGLFDVAQFFDNGSGSVLHHFGTTIQGQEMEMTIWMNMDIPGGAAKMAMKMETQGMTINVKIELTDFKAEKSE